MSEIKYTPLPWPHTKGPVKYPPEIFGSNKLPDPKKEYEKENEKEYKKKEVKQTPPGLPEFLK